MSNLEIMGIILGVLVIAGISVSIFYYIAISRLEKLQKAAQIELMKAQELISLRGQGIVKEYLSFISWINHDLGDEIMKTAFFDTKLLILRDKAKMSDQQYTEAFETFITNLQQVIKEEVQHSVDKINEDFLVELKDKLKDE